MSEQAINLLFDRFGATADNLVPKVIEYEIHMYQIWLVVSIVVYIVGMWLLVLADRLDKKGHDAGALASGMIGLCLALVCAFGVIICAISLHEWHYSPEIMAYKEIFGWIGGM